MDLGNAAPLSAGASPGASTSAPDIGAGIAGASAHPAGPSAEIVILDQEGTIVAVNHAWRTAPPVRGFSAKASGVGASYFELVQVIVPELDEARFRRGLEALRTGRKRELRNAFAIDTAKGPRWRQVTITLLPLGDEIRFVAIHEDMTEFVRAQAALERASEQLLTVQDDERARIALELHDSTAQHLAALGLGLARLRRTLTDAAAGPILDDMSESLAEAVRETRVISYLMKPNSLLREGLASAAERFVRGFAHRTGLKGGYEVRGPVDEAPAPVQHAAFRIVQEALSNVHRHAQATAADVSITSVDDELIVRICDDGRGIQCADGLTEPHLGVGILGMRARVEQLGGRVLVTSHAGGTIVTAVMPVGRTADPAAGVPPAKRTA